MNDARAVFRLTRTGSTTTSLKVSYAIGGSARSGTDFVALSGARIIPTGKRTVDIVVRPVEDHVSEGDETVSFALQRRAAYALGVRRKATIVIRDETAAAYKVARLKVGSAIEYRLYYQEDYQDRHFLTVIDQGGAFVARAHPGVDPNGWGTSVYLQPFLPGATLRHTVVQSVAAQPDGIAVAATGFVSKGTAESYGTWDLQLAFTYDKDAKKVTGVGSYDISLASTLAVAGADLNLLRIASNYLRQVPLLDGTTGDTGDMEYARTIAQGRETTWVPWQQPAHYPMDTSDSFDVTLIGAYNNVDTAAQGHDPIAPAYKPTVRLLLASQTTGVDMIVGYVYDLDKATEFEADNVGVTPLVLQSSSWKDYSFDLQLVSTALTGDGT